MSCLSSLSHCTTTILAIKMSLMMLCILPSFFTPLYVSHVNSSFSHNTQNSCKGERRYGREGGRERYKNLSEGIISAFFGNLNGEDLMGHVFSQHLELSCSISPLLCDAMYNPLCHHLPATQMLESTGCPHTDSALCVHAHPLYAHTIYVGGAARRDDDASQEEMIMHLEASGNACTGMRTWRHCTRHSRRIAEGADSM